MDSKVSPLEIIGNRLPVPDSILGHPNYVEISAISTVVFNGEKSQPRHVIGTANAWKPELYGWRNPVSEHIDAKPESGESYVYFVILSGEVSAIGCRLRDDSEIVIHPKIGDVIRLDESCYHWTEGSGDCIAIFMGCYGLPEDEKVIKAFQRGVGKLSFPTTYSAPRAHPKLQIKRDGEVYAHAEFGDYHYRLMTQKSVDRFHLCTMVCSQCERPAIVVDKHWPYNKQHRCEIHL
jgi:hypothetical protein